MTNMCAQLGVLPFQYCRTVYLFFPVVLVLHMSYKRELETRSITIRQISLCMMCAHVLSQSRCHSKFKLLRRKSQTDLNTCRSTNKTLVQKITIVHLLCSSLTFDSQPNLVVCTVDSQLSIEPLTINVFQRRMWHRRYENIFTTILLPMRVVGVSLLPCERKQRRGSSELGTLSGHVKDHDRPHSSPSLTHHVLVRLSQQRGT